MSDLILLGDEAWTPEEWEAEQRRRETNRRYESRPERRAKKLERAKVWNATHPERRREINRESTRRRREALPHYIGSLHDLGCTGPTRPTGCRCKKIKVYDKPVEKAA